VLAKAPGFNVGARPGGGWSNYPQVN
jgi:hypothetical protein